MKKVLEVYDTAMVHDFLTTKVPVPMMYRVSRFATSLTIVFTSVRHDLFMLSWDCLHSRYLSSIPFLLFLFPARASLYL